MKLSVLGGPLLAASLASAASAQTLPVEKYPYVSGPVTLTSCSVNENTSNSTVSPNSLRINYYVNERGRKLTSITFRVRYAQTPVTITDTGDFGYKQPITHQFNQLGGLPWTGANPTVCRVLTATFADGQVVNPAFDGPDAEAMPAGAPPVGGDSMQGAPPAPALPAPAAPPAAGAPPVPSAPAPSAT